MLLWKMQPIFKILVSLFLSVCVPFILLMVWPTIGKQWRGRLSRFAGYFFQILNGAATSPNSQHVWLMCRSPFMLWCISIFSGRSPLSWRCNLLVHDFAPICERDLLGAIPLNHGWGCASFTWSRVSGLCFFLFKVRVGVFQ